MAHSIVDGEVLSHSPLVLEITLDSYLPQVRSVIKMGLIKGYVVPHQEVCKGLEVEVAGLDRSISFGHDGGRRHTCLLSAVRRCVEETAEGSFVASGQRVFILTIVRILPAKLERVITFGP